jgi:hypothetical protein
MCTPCQPVVELTQSGQLGVVLEVDRRAHRRLHRHALQRAPRPIRTIVAVAHSTNPLGPRGDGVDVRVLATISPSAPASTPRTCVPPRSVPATSPQFMLLSESRREHGESKQGRHADRRKQAAKEVAGQALADPALKARAQIGACPDRRPGPSRGPPRQSGSTGSR